MQIAAADAQPGWHSIILTGTIHGKLKKTVRPWKIRVPDAPDRTQRGANMPLPFL